jgi:organic radical activating enzyme
MEIIFSEIFASIEGESPFFHGERAFFVRFSKCNLHCKRCDTLYEKEGKIEISSLIKKFLDTPIRLLKLTGGEPFLQDKAVIRILECLKNTDREIEIETNGLLQTKIPPAARIVISFKGEKLLGWNPTESWKKAIKTLLYYWKRIPTAAKLTTDNAEEVRKFFQLLKDHEFSGIVAITPFDNDLKEFKKIIESTIFFPLPNQVKFLPRIHKILGMP